MSKTSACVQRCPSPARPEEIPRIAITKRTQESLGEYHFLFLANGSVLIMTLKSWEKPSRPGRL